MGQEEPYLKGAQPRDNVLIEPPHPGETIKEDYLVPLGMSVNRLAGVLGIGTARLNEIVRGRRGNTADTALRRRDDVSAPARSSGQPPSPLRSAHDGAKSRRQDQAGGQAAWSRDRKAQARPC